MEQLVKWEKAKQAIIEAKSVDELLLIRDQAEAFRYAAKQAKESIDAVNNIAEIKIRAERKAGSFLKEKPSASGKRTDLVTPCNQVENKTLKELDVTKRDSSNWQNIAEIPQSDFEKHIEKTKKRKAELTTAGVLGLAKDIKRDMLRKEKSEQGKDIILPNDIKLYNDDFRNVKIERESIDLILTDPPYPKEYLPLWIGLGEFARKHLKENGYLIVYSGQLYINWIMSRLSEKLNYCWMFAYWFNQTQLVHARNVICEWKPILVFKNGDPGKFRDTMSDFINFDKRNKDLHDWQQGEIAPGFFVDHFTDIGNMVCDPFAGSGTFIDVALKMNRKAIGIEIEEENCNIIKQRITETKKN